MSTEPLTFQLRALYRNIDALGGADDGNEFNAGYNSAIDNVLWLLKCAGFEEGKSTAADEIARLSSQLAAQTTKEQRAHLETMRFNGLIMLAKAVCDQFFSECAEVSTSRMRDLRICLQSIEEHRA